MSIAASREEWKALLSKQLADLENITSIDGNVPDENTFRDKFLALPRDGADDPNFEYAFFTRFHESIIFFVREIDTAIGLKSPESLNNIFWSIALTTLEVAIERDFQFSQISQVYKDLNAGVPQDQTNLAQFPRNTDVQKCLQAIFEAYIGCYLQLIKQVMAAKNKKINPGPVKSQLAQAAIVFENKQREWKQSCDLAQQEQQNVQNRHIDDHTSDTRWEHLRHLGRGTFGSVDEVREVGTGSVYARKVIPRRIAGVDEMNIEKRVRNETDIMQKLRHNHIAGVNMFFRSDAYWSIIMLPVADCDLKTFLEKRCIEKDYPQDVLRMIDPWFGCLISALAYAHDESIKHEDIKPSNVLIKGRKVYLTDFGTARDFSELEASTTDSYNEQGTPIYWAPEPRGWGRPADVWALGCVFAEMLTVRQKRSLAEFKQWRHSPGKEFGYAFRANVPKVRRWLKDKINITPRDEMQTTLLEQIFNMLTEDHLQRPEARRIKKQLRVEDGLFCAICA